MFKDTNGYQPLPTHLYFLGLDPVGLSNCHSKMCPLGMTSAQFVAFLDSLIQALGRDKISPCDVRLKGSSAIFYSGPHKPMPWTRIELEQVFFESHKRPPANAVLNAIETWVNSTWLSSDPRPLRRPFNSMYCVGAEKYPSDYDIQVSSNEIEALARSYLASPEYKGSNTMLFVPKYDFIRKELVDQVCPNLTRWALLQSNKLQRGVAVAAYPSVGPPDKTSKIGALSSHFRSTDWRLI